MRTKRGSRHIKTCLELHFSTYNHISDREWGEAGERGMTRTEKMRTGPRLWDSRHRHVSSSRYVLLFFFFFFIVLTEFTDYLWHASSITSTKPTPSPPSSFPLSITLATEERPHEMHLEHSPTVYAQLTKPCFINCAPGRRAPGVSFFLQYLLTIIHT